jgi:hypothetical protein
MKIVAAPEGMLKGQWPGDEIQPPLKFIAEFFPKDTSPIFV